MAEVGVLEGVLRRDRVITFAALLVLSLAAWAYVIAGAGMGAPAWRMTTFGLPPALLGGEPAATAAGMPGMAAASTQATWEPQRFLLLIVMWWSMMVAMMVPSAAPMVLLYARVARGAHGVGRERAPGRSGWFVAGYLAVWLGFSLAAAALQEGLVRLAWISPGLMQGLTREFAAGVLLLAGLYQISPVHDVCLSRCRWPGTFLAQHYRPGVAGALNLGLRHGAYCVGCCWLLMALLFVGGVMNLVWIAALTALVAAEKLLPAGRWIGRAAGAGLIAWGLLLLV